MPVFKYYWPVQRTKIQNKRFDKVRVLSSTILTAFCIHCCQKLCTNNADSVSTRFQQSQSSLSQISCWYVGLIHSCTERVDIRLSNRVWLINQWRPRAFGKFEYKNTSLFNPPKYISLCCQCELCQYFLKRCFENVSGIVVVGGGGPDGSAPSDG